MFTVPVNGLVDVTVAVNVKVPPDAILALDVVSVIDVGTGTPPPPPPPGAVLPPPQPNANVRMNAALAAKISLDLFRHGGIARRSSKSSPLARLPDNQIHRRCTVGRSTGITGAAALDPPVGPVVVSVITTGTEDPFKLATDGLKLRLMPEGRDGPALSVTGLGTLDRGVTFTVAV